MDRDALVQALRTCGCAECGLLVDRLGSDPGAFADIDASRGWTQLDWVRVLRIRIDTTRRGGVRTHGMAEAIAALDDPANASRKLGRATFTFADETWIVLHDAATIVTCFAVERRLPSPP